MPSTKNAIVVELNDKPEYQRVIEGPPVTGGMKVGRVHLEAGKACGEHTTKENEEVLVFLSGRGELLIGEEGEVFEVGVGKVAFIRPQTIHDVKNTGSEPLIYIFCVSPVSN
jgi:mannose-6-phosphate isomerase-like protein (cupin superfamily)